MVGVLVRLAATTLIASGSVAPASRAALSGPVLFTSERSGTWQLWTVEPDGRRPRRLTRTGASDSEPAWSPDGTRVAFVRDLGSWRRPIVVRDVRTGAERTVAWKLYTAVPGWSPDGRQLAFQVSRSVRADGSPDGARIELWTVGADGRAPRRVAVATGYQEWQWSRDGRRLAFVTRAFDAPMLATVNLVDGRRRVLASGRQPSWSPDGRRLVFLRGGDVFTIGADGTAERRVTRTARRGAALVVARREFARVRAGASARPQRRRGRPARRPRCAHGCAAARSSVAARVVPGRHGGRVRRRHGRGLLGARERPRRRIRARSRPGARLAMSGCCTPRFYGKVFNSRLAERSARKYRKRGLQGTERATVAWLTGRGVEGLDVLEVGGGIGAIDIELLRAGATHATNFELSPSYEPVAERLAADAGVGDRFAYRIGDLAHEEAEPAAAVVVMHRVLCCYPEGDRLLRAGARHARRYLVVTVPRDRWWNRAGVATLNGVLRVLRLKFRVFVHPVVSLVRGAEEEGLQRVHDGHGAVWQTVAFDRGA